LVFSTLHTNDAPGAITRLVDMGIEPFLTASALELIIAQRLVRRLCSHCTRPAPINSVKLAQAMSVLGIDPAEAIGLHELPSAVGCDRCRKTGFRGRVGLFEILRPTDELRDLIVKREPTRALVQCAREQGMHSLAQSGWNQVRAGLTTLEEVLQVINVSEL
jgi:type II secretory ATPase GspE/PulE/Tfp pilus assembly ATPase PilB-like protein